MNISTGRQISGELAGSILFDGLTDSVIKEVVATGRLLQIPQGQYVYRQNNRINHFFMVIEGEVELIRHTGDGDRIVVGRISPGGHFGETSLLTGECNSLDGQARCELTLLKFDRTSFFRIIKRYHVIQYRLCVALANRLRISFKDQAVPNKAALPKNTQSGNGDHHFCTTAANQNRLLTPTLSRQTRQTIRKLRPGLEPILLTGEIGTGRRMLAYEIHNTTSRCNSSYVEIDVVNITSAQLDEELFGFDQDLVGFSQVSHLGGLEKSREGSLVLYNAEHMEPDFQRQLVRVLRRRQYQKIGTTINIPLQSRIIFICRDAPGEQDSHNRLLPSLFSLVADNQFRVPPLREHRRDIPGLVEFYLKRFSLQYGKSITRVDERTLGMIMSYGWPGNLEELASVTQRAVILGDNKQPLHSRIFLGVPRPEGKWEFNLLRLKAVRNLVIHSLYPALPKAVVGVFLILMLTILFFGPKAPNENIALSLSWKVGWPLLIFSFFFLARTWCSICGLALPGQLAQLALKPRLPTPDFLRRHSGWIVAILCIILFWVELTWNAYESPILTGYILLTISSCSLVFSMFFERRVWCRYLCPLGGLNALFSMSSIVELRANSHMCMNHCQDHSCYNGTENAPGCPMFRHPFMVDNNRDCILCGQCIKNCPKQSIHLNLRLAPQELWNQRSPRLEDSLLIISLAAISLLFILLQNHRTVLDSWCSSRLSFSFVFFGFIALHIMGYTLYNLYMTHIIGSSKTNVAAALSYGLIPLILAAFLAAHLELFICGISEVLQYTSDFFHPLNLAVPTRIMSREAAFVLQALTLLGGLLAAVIATKNIVKRLQRTHSTPVSALAVPTLLLSFFTALCLFILR